MSLVTREGTLLRAHPYSETSRILRFLTPDAGVVAVVARGVRAQASKGRASLDLFDEAELTYNHRSDRDLHTLREVRTTGPRHGLGRDLVRFAGASFLAEMILGHTLEEGNPALHARFGAGLNMLLAEPREALPGVILSTAWGLLSAFGFPPEMDRCVRCGGPIPDQAMVRFDLAQGGLRCPACVEGGEGPRLGPGARRDLGALLGGDPPPSLRGPRGQFHLVERFALHHLDRRSPFRSSGTLAPLLAE